MGGTNISEGVQRFQVVSEIFVPGGPDISGVQIFRDRSISKEEVLTICRACADTYANKILTLQR